jgi:phage FluMu protein Com
MSNMRTSIKCNCGQRIIAKDVVQHGKYLRLFGPSFVYVKFRCPRCKKLGEQFIKQEEWEEGILREIASELNNEERDFFAGQTSIDIMEQIDFHFALENLNDLKSLEAAVAPPRKARKAHPAAEEQGPKSE